MKNGAKLIESYWISQKNVNSKDILISKIKYFFNFLWKILHDFSTGIIRIAFWCYENGRFEPLWFLIFYEIFGDLLIYLI